jgi:hypothetical protein
MPDKASSLDGRRIYVTIGLVEVDEDMILKVEGGACGVRDKDGNLIGTYKDQDGIEVSAGCTVSIQLSWVTFVKS